MCFETIAGQTGSLSLSGDFCTMNSRAWKYIETVDDFVNLNVFANNGRNNWFAELIWQVFCIVNSRAWDRLRINIMVCLNMFGNNRRKATGSLNYLLQVLVLWIPGLGKYSKVDVFISLHVFGNTSRNKLTHWINFARLCIMNFKAWENIGDYVNIYVLVYPNVFE